MSSLSRTKTVADSLDSSKSPFVVSSENQLGIGKLVEVEGDEAVVSYFHSPADEDLHDETVSGHSLTSLVLQPQMRVYFHDPKTLVWRVGRVLDYQPSDGLYLVRFPNDDSHLVDESALQVRWARAIDDPTVLLALRLNETPFWHVGRSDFVEHVFTQRCYCGGMPAALSSSIELVKHQLAVVRRVLHDPFHRYLLADEVGLGKTIEAGILIRQFVLDEPTSHETVVVVPEALCRQWEQELIHRFHLSDALGETIHVVGHRDRAGLVAHGEAAKMIVVDEAHHVAAWAWSADSDSRDLFSVIQGITNPIDRRVLLLSATPVLHNEQAFLAMLHLLDPVVYALDDLEAFRDRIEHRQEIAEALLTLTEDESNFFLEKTLEDLGDFFTDDEHFHDLRRKLATLIEEDVPEDHADRMTLIRALRSNVNETWRLHRRLLRNRRTEETACYLPGRGGVERCDWQSDQVHTLEELLGDWRLLHAESLYDVEDDSRLRQTRDLVRILEEAAACDPNVLAQLVDLRLGRTVDASGTADVPAAEMATVRDCGRVDGENDLLARIRELATGQQLPRLRALLPLIEGLQESGDSSIVIFTNYPATADQVYSFLVRRLGDDVVLRHDWQSLRWTRFHQANCGLVLVCDRRAEEGLNLQNRRSVAVHYDLPFSPNRIEQRIGRLDRFGIGKPIRSFVVVPENSRVQSAWFTLLAEAFAVFDKSIASLQYVIEEELERVWTEFPDAGSESFEDTATRLGGTEGRIQEELRRIRAQDEIDSFEDDTLTDEVFDQIELVDQQAGREAREILDNWLASRLHFRPSGENGREDEVVRYQFCRVDDFGRIRGRNTLMPYPEFTDRFADSIDDSEVRPPVVVETVPIAVNRQISQRRATRLARIGDPLIDAIEEQIRWDDRGICYAMWRFRPDFKSDQEAEFAFRFDFVVEADKEILRAVCRDWPGASFNALRRRADAAFPAFPTEVWLDSELEPIRNDALQALLDQPYRSHFISRQPREGRDFNLNPQRWEKVNELCDITIWRGLCHAARYRAEQFLRDDSRLPKLVEQRAAEAADRAETQIEQFESHLARLSGAAAEAVQRECEFERRFADVLHRAICTPSLRVDSIGAVFLSAHDPFTENEDEGD